VGAASRIDHLPIYVPVRMYLSTTDLFIGTQVSLELRSVRYLSSTNYLVYLV
jgi:hypothetical protein